ncbi:MAM domain-containing glycosylphosphatidylinositol anchor protein 1-like [Lingula anatina]|uniref:MAM domain-containing glycosylphosphatidylinositol anchor protein 1-like n=1 Tax=Lingula anatina TaxID=7574 RepID=A0A1S3HSZ5_LINAN|nr:MAM domain-containing glycosylphosphatidylinositol anchor protein 1-like [Lingula anatina]|eukprot:XP_013389143.1 MAM domain-containing glycosylphosphatidylinositol anchor protein 1-like [Lingula anatina]
MTVSADQRIIGCLMAAVGLLVTLLCTLHGSANSVTPEFQCDFDEDMDPFCGFRQSTDDNFNWTRNNGSTPSRDTGPQHDHTTGAGYYIFIEASMKGPGYKASMISPSFISLNIPRCLRFAYHMYGRTVGTLQISSQNEGNSTRSKVMWSLTGDQGDQWHVASQTVPAETTRFVIEGVRGSGALGDIAVDDITLTPGYCGSDIRDGHYNDQLSM